MGGKPREPREPKKRSGKLKIIWQGGTGKEPDTTRIVAIDKDSLGMPCILILEVKKEDSFGTPFWIEPSTFTDMSWLDKKLALDFATKAGTLPKWATPEAQAKRDAANKEYQEKKIAWDRYRYAQQKEEKKIDEGHHQSPDGTWSI